MHTCIAFIAITNLAIGYILGRICLCLPDSESRQPDRPDANPINLELSSHAEFETRGRIEQTASVPVVGTEAKNTCPAPATLPDTAARNAAHGPWLAPKTWFDFEQQLDAAMVQIGYVRLAADKKLAQEAAKQLRSLANSWRDRIAACLEASVAGEVNTDLAETSDAALLEMCLAQLESTVTNLDLLNWSDAIDILVDKLEREAELLKRNRPRAARGK